MRRQDILGQFSMVNLELYNIVEDIKNVSKAFVVHPKNVNAENATSMFNFTAFIYIANPFITLKEESLFISIFLFELTFNQRVQKVKGKLLCLRGIIWGFSSCI